MQLVYFIDWTWLWLVVCMIVHSLSENRFANVGPGFDIVVILGQIYTATNDCSCWRHVMCTIQSTDIGVTLFPVKFNDDLFWTEILKCQDYQQLA